MEIDSFEAQKQSLLKEQELNTQEIKKLNVQLDETSHIETLKCQTIHTAI
jgi:hypothetical protein